FPQPNLSVSTVASNALKSAVGNTKINQDITGNSPSVRHSSAGTGVGIGFDTISNTGSISLASSAKAAVKTTFSIQRKKNKGDSYGIGNVSNSSKELNIVITNHSGSVAEQDSPDGSPVQSRNTRFSVEFNEKKDPEQNILSIIVPAIISEQNFIMDIFGLIDKVAPQAVPIIPEIVTPELMPQIQQSTEILPRKELMKAWFENLGKMRDQIKDVKVNRRIQEIIENMFENFREELQHLIELGIKYDQTYSIAMMIRIEELQRRLEHT
ncbi:hypothetical protein HK096_000268, partial [Nowakowskiella sp. JEL0078]